MKTETISQRKFGVKMTFQFEEDKLTRTHADYTGENQISVFYETIDVENTSLLTVNVLRRFILAISVFTIVTIVSSAMISIFLANLFTLVSFILFATSLALNFYKLLLIRYTVLQIPGRSGINSIRVIHDKNHDFIIEKIRAGWVSRLRKLNATVNPANDPNRELNKFKWLKDHAVISEIEYQDAIAKIKATHELRMAGNPPQENKPYLN